LHDAGTAHAPFLIADRTSGEIALSPEIGHPHEILFDIEAGEVRSIGWQFDVIEGGAVDFSMSVVSNRTFSSSGESGSYPDNPLRLMPIELLTSVREEDAEYKIRDNLKCIEDEGVFAIPEGHAKLLVILRWSVPAATPGLFSTLMCSNRRARKTFLRYNIEIKPRDGLADEGWHPLADRALLTGTASGLTDLEMETFMLAHAEAGGNDHANDRFRLDPADVNEQQMMADFNDDIVNSYFS
jgi:hypothetical protein